MSIEAQIGARILATLRAQAERNRQAGAVRVAQVRTIVQAHPGALTARRVRELLPNDQAVSVRRLQEILRILRAESSASRF